MIPLNRSHTIFEYKETWEVSGTAKLPAISPKQYLVVEVSGDLDNAIFLGRWSNEDEFYIYGGFGNEEKAIPKDIENRN